MDSTGTQRRDPEVVGAQQLVGHPVVDGHQRRAARRADRCRRIKLRPLLPLVRHSVEVRRVDRRMPIARHVAVPLVIRENHNKVQLLLGQRLSTEPKRQNQAKRDPFQAVQQRRSHVQQPTGGNAPLKEKEANRLANGLLLLRLQGCIHLFLRWVIVGVVRVVAR